MQGLADDRPEPGEGLAVQTDLTDVEQIRDGFDAVREAFGPVDIDGQIDAPGVGERFSDRGDRRLSTPTRWPRPTGTSSNRTTSAHSRSRDTSPTARRTGSSSDSDCDPTGRWTGATGRQACAHRVPL